MRGTYNILMLNLVVPHVNSRLYKSLNLTPSHFVPCYSSSVSVRLDVRQKQRRQDKILRRAPDL